MQVSNSVFNMAFALKLIVPPITVMGIMVMIAKYWKKNGSK